MHNAHTRLTHGFRKDAYYSLKSEYTSMNIIIIKTYQIPKIFKKNIPNQPNSMGASDRNMKWGTFLVFELEFD